MFPKLEILVNKFYSAFICIFWNGRHWINQTPKRSHATILLNHFCCHWFHNPRSRVFNYFWGRHREEIFCTCNSIDQVWCICNIIYKMGCFRERNIFSGCNVLFWRSSYSFCYVIVNHMLQFACDFIVDFRGGGGTCKL